MKTNSKLLILFLSVLALHRGLVYGDPVKLALVDELINEAFIPINHISGMGLSIVQDGLIVLSKGYGTMNMENNEDARNDTIFALASVAKSFTSTLAVKVLSERFPTLGESVLDVPVVQLHPTFNFTFSDRFRSEQMSFRDLISFRHCLIDEVNDLVFGGVRTNAEYNYRTRYQVEACGHRAGGYYNNALTTLAGDIIASLEGLPYHILLKNFMQQIGMVDSTTIDFEGSFENNPKMSQGYYRRGGEFHKFNRDLLRRVHIETGAGGLLSTANDMAQYMLLHLNKGKVGDNQIISEEAISWMRKPSLLTWALSEKQTEEDVLSGQYAIGFGFALSLYKGYSAYHHSGSWPSFVSHSVIVPAKNIGVFLTTNGPGEIMPELDHSAIAFLIFDIMRGETVDLKSALTKIKGQAPSFSLPGEGIGDGIWNFNNSRALKKASRIMDFDEGTKVNFTEVIGIYGDEGAGDLNITIDEEDDAFLQISFGSGDWSVGRLLPVNGSDNLFLVEWTSDIVHHFYSYPEEFFPTPLFHVEFHPGAAYFFFNGALRVVFIKDATIDTFPVIPWDPSSCGPDVDSNVIPFQ